MWHRVKLGSLSNSTTDILGLIILCHGNFAVHCRIYSSIPSLYPWETSNTMPRKSWQPKMYPDIAQCSWGQSPPWLRTTELEKEFLDIMHKSTVHRRKKMMDYSFYKNVKLGTSLAVQWLTPHSQCRGHGFDPWLGN